MTADLHHLAAAYALDALDGDEREAFEAHLPACDMCRQEVTEFLETAGHLSSATAAVPPDDLKARVMSEIATTRQDSPIAPVTTPGDATSDVADLSARRRRFTPVNMLAAAAAVMLLVVGAVVIVGGRGGVDPDDVLSAPDAIVTPLGTTEATDSGSVNVVWSAERDEVVVDAAGLPDPGDGKTYALWLLGADGPVPAGLFTPDDGRFEPTVFEVEDLDSAGWGVTIEPDGGSDQPTTDILFLTQYEA